MGLWIAIAFGLATVLTVAFLFVVRPVVKRQQAQRRRRYELQETGQRVPLAKERGPRAVGVPDASGIAPVSRPYERRAPTLLEALREGGAPLAEPPPLEPLPPSPTPVKGRIVQTPDGEAVLTTPPFTLRPSMLGRRSGRYVNRLSLRVPAWVICCPKVRLDAVLLPTPPEGRDPADWAGWRRRVRWRSIDVLLIDRRTWRPLVAIVFDHPRTAPVARSIAGGQDRMVDEVLGEVGLPMLRVSGNFENDWAAIEPYIEDAILPGVSEETHADVRAETIGPEAAVNLLRLDKDQGWILG